MSNVNLSLTQQETQALTELLDAGVKAVGLRAAPAAAHLLGKIEEAVRAVQEAEKSAAE